MANPKTGALMSKSLGTGVFLSSPANEMYGAVMAQPDEMIEILFINCTRIPLTEKNNVLGSGPRNAKAKVAFEIVKKFYGEKKAQEAEAAFISQFSKGGLPEDIVVKVLPVEVTTVSEAAVLAGLVESKSEVRRLIQQGGVKLNGEVVKEDKLEMKKEEQLLQVGKRRFAKIKSK